METDVTTEQTKNEEVKVESAVPSGAEGLFLGQSENPFEAAATLFGLYAPMLESKVKELSTGELRRLVNALVQYPINEKQFIHDSKKLKEAFAMGHRLLEAKWIMFMHSMMEHGAPEVEETKTETSQEEPVVEQQIAENQ